MQRPTPTKEQILLFNLLKGEIPSDLEEIDSTVLFNLFQRHRLFPLATKLLPLFEEKERGRWKQAIRLGSVKTLGLLSLLFEIIDGLEAQGIKVLPLKGPVLAQTLYGDISQRHMRDLDLLVQETELQRALQVLYTLGYRLKFPEKELSERQWRAYLRQQYDVALVHKEKGTILELHTRIAYPGLLGGFEHLIIEKPDKVELAGRSLSSMSPENTFLYLAIHGAHHLFFRLFWLRDFAEVIGRWDLDHSSILVKAKQMGAERMLGVGLRLAATLFGTKIPGEYQELLQDQLSILNQLEEHCLGAILYPDFYGRKSRKNVLRFSLKMKAGWIHKWTTLSSVYYRWRIRKFLVR